MVISRWMHFILFFFIYLNFHLDSVMYHVYVALMVIVWVNGSPLLKHHSHFLVMVMSHHHLHQLPNFCEMVLNVQLHLNAGIWEKNLNLESKIRIFFDFRQIMYKDGQTHTHTTILFKILTLLEHYFLVHHLSLQIEMRAAN